MTCMNASLLGAGGDRGTKRPAGGSERHLGNEAQLVDPEAFVLEGMVALGENTQALGAPRLKNCVVGRNCVIEDGVELDGFEVTCGIRVDLDRDVLAEFADAGVHRLIITAEGDTIADVEAIIERNAPAQLLRD